MKAVLLIDMPERCIDCPCGNYWNNVVSCMACEEDYTVWEDSPRPDYCPLKPLNKIVKAGDRELQIYERKWLYEHLEEEFELQKRARDFYRKYEIEDE